MTTAAVLRLLQRLTEAATDHYARSPGPGKVADAKALSEAMRAGEEEAGGAALSGVRLTAAAAYWLAERDPP